MKNYTYFKIMTLTLSLTLFISCEEDLIVEPNDSINEIDFLNDPKNATNLVNGVYNKQLDFDMWICK